MLVRWKYVSIDYLCVLSNFLIFSKYVCIFTLSLWSFHCTSPSLDTTLSVTSISLASSGSDIVDTNSSNAATCKLGLLVVPVMVEENQNSYI